MLIRPLDFLCLVFVFSKPALEKVGTKNKRKSNGISLALCLTKWELEEQRGKPRRDCLENVNIVQPPRRVYTTDRLEALRSAMEDQVILQDRLIIQAYIITSTDEHQSTEIEDYEKRLQYISGFSGSYGDAVVTFNKSALWTDGRYHLQADEEIDCNWLLFREGHNNIPKISDWLKQELPNGSIIGVYSKVISEYKWNKLSHELDGSTLELRGFNTSLIDGIWVEDRPERQYKDSFVLEDKLAGKSYIEKVKETREKIRKTGADAMVITSLDEIAWLLNMRGRDIPFSQFIRAYVILDMNNIFLYINDTQLDQDTKQYFHATGVIPESNSVTLKSYAKIFEHLKTRTGVYNKILVPSHCVYSEGASHAIYDHIKPRKRLPRQSPIINLKAVKNANEIKIMREVNIRDAAAVCDCFAYIEKRIESEEVQTEESLAEYLDQHRYEQNNSFGNSFRTRAAFGYNGAYPKYVPTGTTNARIFTNSTVVLDSGGQYYGGTTVVTRTLHFGTPTSDMIDAYTRVLIGLIQFSSLVFPSHMKMAVADSLTRASLWEVGLDFEQESGHGVGAFLGTHESPINVRFDSQTSMQQVFKPGYFLTTAPGYYRKGDFGVRLENMLEVIHSPHHSFLQFKTITYVPFERKLMNLSLLSNQHRRWLNDYNRNVRHYVGSELKKQKRMSGFFWMMEETKYIPDHSNTLTCRPLLVILAAHSLLIKMFVI